MAAAADATTLDTSTTTTYSGSCMCEAIKFQVTGDPEKVFACYCTDCSKNAGGPFQIIAKYDISQITVHDPEQCQRSWTIQKTLTGFVKPKVFCSRCGCTLWTLPQASKGKKFMVRTSLLHDGGYYDLTPKAEFFAPLRPAFVSPLEGAKPFDTMPGH